MRRYLHAIVAGGALATACQSGGEPPPPPPVGRLAASPPWLSIEAGDTITGDTIRLTLFTDSGVAIPGGAATWSSSDTAVAQVGAMGLVRGRHPGVATIHALAASAQASVPITVTDPVLIGAGDMGTCASTNDEATARLLDSLAGTVFTAGDNDYVDATPPPAYGVCFDSTWGRHKWRVRPAAGDDDSLTGFYAYFGAVAHGPTGYYSYDLGTWHVIVLNSAVPVDSTQVQWLRADLAAHPVLCTVAISHRPRFSSGNSGNSPGQGPFFQALDEAGAELVLDGNDHDYERFAAQQADQTPDPDGLVEIVVGTGGKSHGRINLPLAANSLVHMRIPTGCCDSSCMRRATTGSSLGWRGGRSRIRGAAAVTSSAPDRPSQSVRLPTGSNPADEREGLHIDDGDRIVGCAGDVDAGAVRLHQNSGRAAAYGDAFCH